MMFLCIDCGKNLDENRFYRKVKNRCKDCSNKKVFYKKIDENSHRSRTSSE